MIGRRLGRYRITGKLGEGGMGSVWRAEDTLLGREIALKFLPRSLAGDIEARERQLEEARMASRLDHPGIATIHDAGNVDGQHFIAMQLVEGETLKQLLASGPLDVRNAISLVRDAADALSYAHAHGVLHRDVTSRNIMRKHDGRAVVVDFGLATQAEHVAQTQGVRAGTIAYMAPEVLQGEPADARADVYGLGVVLYELLTGRLPFPGERPEAALYQAVHTPAPRPSASNPAVPPKIDRIVQACLAKNPDERPQTTSELGDALRAARPLDAPKRFSRRKLGIGALALVAVAWISLEFAGRDRDLPPGDGLIAVLPFRNQSASPSETDYLAMGLAERLAAKLAQLEGVDIVPWWSSQRYGTSSLQLTEIAAQLGADALLVGSFAKQDDRIRGSFTLVDGKTGRQRWLEEFVEPSANTLVLQDRLAGIVARRLKGPLSPAENAVLERPISRNALAYESYLKGRETLALADSRHPNKNDRALHLFEDAISIDPNFADAYIGLGAALHNRYFFGWGGYSELPESENAYLQALRLDNGSLEARAGLMRVYWSLGQTEKCLQLGQEAARLGKGGIQELFVLAEGYYLGGLYSEAIGTFKQILDRDPNIAGAYWFLVVAYAQSGKWEEAVSFGEEYLRRFGADSYVHGHLGISYHALGDSANASRHYDVTLELSGDDTYFCAPAGQFHMSAGDSATALDIWRTGVDILRQRFEKYPDNMQLRTFFPSLLAKLGDRDGVLGEEALLAQLPQRLWTKYAMYSAWLRLGDYKRAADSIRSSLNDGYIPAFEAYELVGSPEAVRAFRDSPYYQAYRQEFEAEGDRLRRMYFVPQSPLSPTPARVQ